MWHQFSTKWPPNNIHFNQLFIQTETHKCTHIHTPPNQKGKESNIWKTFFFGQKYIKDIHTTKERAHAHTQIHQTKKKRQAIYNKRKFLTLGPLTDLLSLPEESAPWGREEEDVWGFSVKYSWINIWLYCGKVRETLYWYQIRIYMQRKSIQLALQVIIYENIFFNFMDFLWRNISKGTSRYAFIRFLLLFLFQISFYPVPPMKDRLNDMVNLLKHSTIQINLLLESTLKVCVRTWIGGGLQKFPKVCIRTWIGGLQAKNAPFIRIKALVLLESDSKPWTADI